MPSSPIERPGARFPQHFRVKYTRSKTGCLSCRRRKKRCDEHRPCCTACTRNGLDCKYSAESNDLTRNTCSIWRPVLSSFRNINHACELTPQSASLLEHYTQVTAILLPAWTQSKAHNPFINFVLPLAQNDDVLMHAVLAVSGAHLSHKLAGTACVEQATYKHYSWVLRKLRHDIAHGGFSGTHGILRLLSVLAFLCQYEIIAGSAQTTLSLHFQAIQQTFSRLGNSGAGSAPSDGEREIFSWIHEGYSYMVLCNFIAPTPTPICSAESVLGAASNLGLSVTQSLSTIFGGSRLLFEMIPRANAIFCRRLAEQSAGQKVPTPAFLEQHAELSLDVETWKMPLPPHPHSGHTSPNQDPAPLSEWAHNNMAAEFIRHALRIYIITARSGQDAPTPDIESFIQTNVEAMVQISLVVAPTQSAGILMWAVLIGGSCVRDQKYRQLLAYWLNNAHHQMKHLSLVLLTLAVLWADPSPQAFGPYGLRYISEKHNLNFCIM